jgi:hypothetical protein
LNTACNTFLTVVQNLPHRTVVQNLHPEGYGSDSIGLDSSFSSLHVRGASPPCSESKEKIEAKSKPENLEPSATSKPTPVMAVANVSDGQVKKARYAPDGPLGPFSLIHGQTVSGLWLAAHG